MRLSNRFPRFAAAAVLAGVSLPAALGVSQAATGGSPAADVVAGTWQHHKVTMNYFGITTLFTCDGLENHVRQILLYLGARQDLKVSATGCPGSVNAPSRTAWVNVDFYSLEPAANTAAPGTVKASWSALQLNSNHPRFMDAGDCELIQNMKDLALKNFTLRDVDYRTDCVPHDLNLDGFSVKGEALKVASPAA
jgi:hypothetical protein